MIGRLKRIVTDKSVLKFLVVGVVSFAIDYGLLLILHDVFGAQLNVATTIAYLTGLMVNFTLNKVWTFSAPKGAKQSAKQALQYGILVVFNLLATNIIVSAAEASNVGPEFSKPIATAAIMVLNYVVYQRIIFRERPPIEPFAG
ncbi:MAG TPA: GtrA family protein [Candidatus Saccharimonadales bacterium]|nr:GtrA family protein [Candidatus Saccharimonadales bacterium]